MLVLFKGWSPVPFCSGSDQSPAPTLSMWFEGILRAVVESSGAKKYKSRRPRFCFNQPSEYSVTVVLSSQLGGFVLSGPELSTSKNSDTCTGRLLWVSKCPMP